LANMIIKDYDAIVSGSDAVLTALAQNFPRELHFWERGWKQEFYSIAAGFFPTCIRVRDTYFDWPCGTILTIIPSYAGLYSLAMVFYQFLKLLVRSFVQDTFQIHKDATDLLV
nr:hypothetical protein [Tanacetum cinerariifolium]